MEYLIIPPYPKAMNVIKEEQEQALMSDADASGGADLSVIRPFPVVALHKVPQDTGLAVSTRHASKLT
jgi:hypothetical protein